MNSDLLRESGRLPMRGVYPPMITPLSRPDCLDGDGLERLIEHILAGGVHGLFILGTTGEAPALGYRLRREMIRLTCRQVGKRVPVLVGVTDTAFSESVELAIGAWELGATAAVAAAPYYFAESQPELCRYYERLAAAIPLPLFLYNTPFNSGHTLSVDTVRRAAEIPGVLGVKDSSGDMLYFHLLQDALRDVPEFTLLVGPEELMAEAVLLGGHGGMCGGANICPRLYVALYEAAAKGDLACTRALHGIVMRISASLYRITGDHSSYLAGLKGVLSLLGICSDTMTEPFQSFGPRERDELRRQLESVEPELARFSQTGAPAATAPEKA